MPKIEFDLTEEQLEKVKVLKDNGIGVGDAIDQLFEIKDVALKHLDNVEKSVIFVEQLKNSSMDSSEKVEVVKERYANEGKDPDDAIREVKEKVNWGRDFLVQ